MKEADSAIKSGFIIKSTECGNSIELLENYELNKEFIEIVCIPYFKNVYKDLSARSPEPEKGINKSLFLEYVNLPAFIGERLFNIMDSNENGYLDIGEFQGNILKFYTSDFNIKMKLIFDMYDFNKDEKVSKEDVTLLLSHVPLEAVAKESSKSREGKITQKGGGEEKYSDRAESQTELHNLIQICFGEKSEITFDEFKHICEVISSEIFLGVFTLVKPSLPSLTQFKRFEKGLKKKSDSPLFSPSSGRRFAQAKMLSKFSPLAQLVKSATPKTDGVRKEDENFTAEGKIEEEKREVKRLAPSKFQHKRAVLFPKPADVVVDSPIGPVVRISKKNSNFSDVLSSLEESKAGKEIIFCECGKEVSDFAKLLCANCLENLITPKLEGELLKKRKTDLKLYWVSLEKKELYYYESKESKTHKCMHSLLGCFVREETTEKIGGNVMFPFSLLFPKKTKKYYAKTKEEYKKWVDGIKTNIGYASLLDFYDLKEELGKGKFGIVRAGVHKKSGKKVAVKIMKKTIMSHSDIELVRQEIEILKMCQHPNLIQMHDVFENVNYIYIVMEILEGGDLFSYSEKRLFKISEERASTFIHSIAVALYYLHSYGIVHRDIKPENILLTDTSELADVKIVDFGLSKLLGPTEQCKEPFGTLSYVAPEVLLQRPYGKEVDVWSLGILTHFLLVGFLPFDNEDEKEVAQLTIYAEPDYRAQEWKSVSKLGVEFVKKLLTKDPAKRPTVKEILQHPWIMKDGNAIKEARINASPGSDFSLYSIAKPEKASPRKVLLSKKSA